MTSSPALPPDRGHVRTEQRHDRSLDLDTLSVRECVDLIIDDHRAVLDAARDDSGALAQFIDALVLQMRAGGRLVYLGAGTSGRLGVLDASECPPTFQSDPEQVIGLIAGGDAALRRSSEAREDDPGGAREALESLRIGAKDSVLGIAAGGTTPFVLGGLSIAKALGSMTGLLTCAAPREAIADCDHLMVLDTGPELLAGSTRLKAGSATKLALNAITTTAFVHLGKVYSNLMVDLRATNDKLTDRAIRILIESCPGLSRDSAAAILREAGGRLKTAIVMHRMELGRDAAEARLAEHGNRLRDVIG